MDFEKMAREYVTTFRASDTGDASVCYTMEYRMMHVLRAAFAAGREAGIAEAIKACENKADYWGTLNDEFANKAVMRAVDAIRALPGKEGE